VFGSLRVRHFGPRPLIEDGSVNSRNTTIWNGEVGYRLSSKARLVLEAFNIFDANDSDIDYFYASLLPGDCRRCGGHSYTSGSPKVGSDRYPILVLRHREPSRYTERPISDRGTLGGLTQFAVFRS
jgi:hypothetical protein